jgi:TRAP-type mannitol/chloroaromatic compound transport system permease small subunit
MPAWIRFIDAVSRAVGKAATFGLIVMIAVGAWNTLGRFVGRFLGVRLASNTLLELQWYLFSLIFLFGASWLLRLDGHVRVDVLAARLSRKTRAWFDLIGHILLLIPFAVVTMVLSWPVVHFSFVVREVSPDPGGLPRWPLKLAVLVAFALLIAQATAEVGRRVIELRAARATSL